jgi:hypothetical protein
VTCIAAARGVTTAIRASWGHTAARYYVDGVTRPQVVALMIVESSTRGNVTESYSRSKTPMSWALRLSE